MNINLYFASITVYSVLAPKYLQILHKGTLRLSLSLAVVVLDVKELQ